MEITADVLKVTFRKRQQGNLRRVLREIADIFIMLRLLIVADRLEGAEQARMLRQD